MKPIRLLVVALLPLMLCANAPAQPKAERWLLAQVAATCQVENHRVPAGSKMCRQQRVWVCSPYGNWMNTGEAC